MITLIRRLFIKDYQNTKDKVVREKHGLVASIGGIITNIILFVIKLLIGIFAGSMSIISDAINNLTDMISCVASLLGFKLASKPADKDHPFGHERVEYVTGMIISFVIIAVAILLGYSSITKFIDGLKETPVANGFDTLSFVVLGIAILGKILLGLFYKGMGTAIDSLSLKASKQDSYNDAICTGAVMVCALVQYFGDKLWGINLWYLDPIMSLVISVIILLAGINLVKETASPLIGISPDSDFVVSLTDDVLSHEGVLGIHDLVIHSYGPTKIFVTLHCEVDAYQNVMELHDMIDNIEEEIANKYQCEITIHMDPIDTKSTEIPVLKEVIGKTLLSINEKLQFHDLRTVAGPTHTNVLFDVLMPIDEKIDKDELTETLKKEISKIDKKYNLVIKIDNEYCHK